MRIDRWIVTICVLLAASAASAARAEDCKLTQASSLDIDVSADQLLVPVMLNGAPKKLRLELESGTSFITHGVVDELDLSTHELVNIGWGAARDGVRIEYYTIVPKFQLGSVTGEKVQFLVLPKNADISADGAMGTAVMANLDYDLDIAHQKLGLFLQSHCPGQVEYWSTSPAARLPFVQEKAGHITTTMMLDGKPVRIALRTTGPSFMGMTTLFRFFGVNPDDPRLIQVSSESVGLKWAGADRKVFSYPFQALTADGLSIKNPRIFVIDEPPGRRCRVAFSCYDVADVELGLSVLNKLHVFVSNKEKLLYVTGADAR